MAVGDTLKRDIGLGVLAVVVMLGLLGWSFWRLENGTDRLRDTELRFEAAAQDLLATIGFDGMIHDFKNCVLRPDEPRYCAETEENAALATSQLDTLSGLAAEAGLGLEVEAVRDAALAYGAAADTVRQLHAQGLPIAEIDARVRYDDVPASRQIYATLTLTRDAMNDRIAEVVRSLRIQSLAATAALLLVLGGFGILLRRDYFLSVERERRFAAVFSALSGGLPAVKKVPWSMRVSTLAVNTSPTAATSPRATATGRQRRWANMVSCTMTLRARRPTPSFPPPEPPANLGVPAGAGFPPGFPTPPPPT